MISEIITTHQFASNGYKFARFSEVQTTPHLQQFEELNKNSNFGEDEVHESHLLLYPQEENESSPRRHEGRTGMLAPFTDSGYRSACIMEPCLSEQYDEQQSPVLPNAQAKGGEDEDEAKTLYSMGSTFDLNTARKYISDLSSDIFGKLRRHFIDPRNRPVLSKVLPELIKAFAVKICHDYPSRENRNIMYFIHKRHEEIATQVKAMFSLDDEDEPDRDRARLEDMSVHDKVIMWSSKAAQEYPDIPIDDLFEGVKDDEEDSIDQSQLSGYYRIIQESPAYEWFLTNVAKESILKLDSAQPRIRHRILSKLPAGTISKKRTPNIHQLTIDLEWHNSMEERLRQEVSEESTFLSQHYRKMIVMTGSPHESQGVTIKQYLAQTWPITGLQILDALGTATTKFTGKAHVSHLGNIQLEINILPSHLIVTATGPAYFVADCGELLAWIGSALLSDTQNLNSYCLPLITRFQLEATLFTPQLIESKSYCDINFEIAQLGTLEKSLSTQNFSENVFQQNAFILGFPVRRRPEGYLGLELTFVSLLHLLQASKAELSSPRVFIKGYKNALILVKHTNDVFLWKLDHSSAEFPSHCAEHCISLNVEGDYGPLDRNALVAGRHIISMCACGAFPAEEPHGNPKEPPLVEFEVTQSQFPTQIDPSESPKISSRNLRAGRDDKIFSGRPKSPDLGTAVGFASIGPPPSGFIQVSPTLFAENLESSESVSKTPNLLFENHQPSLITASSEDSLDSDMFSISDFSFNLEQIDHEEKIHPIVKNIAHRLFAGFRSSTQCQSSPSNGGENSGPVARPVPSVHSGNASRDSLKRKLPQEEEDGRGEDGSCPHRPKKVNSSQGDKAQKFFACPYLKKDATEYSACVGFSLSRIRDVKLHLHRKHTPERYCQRCHAANFPTTESLQSHIDNETCSSRGRPMLTWISHEQRNELHRKSKPNISREDQWFAIWEILFPGHQRPNSVYVDTDLAVRVRQFREHCTIQGPTVIAEIIESDLALLSPDTTAEQRELILRRAIAEGINNLFEDWLSNNSSASSTPGQESNGRTQDSRNETPASSMVDSGVAMGGQNSFRESRFQRGDLSFTFGSSTEDLTSQQVAADIPAQSSASHAVGPIVIAPILAQSEPLAWSSSMIGDPGLGWGDPINGLETDPNTIFHPPFDTDALLAPNDMAGGSLQPGEDYLNGGTLWGNENFS